MTVQEAWFLKDVEATRLYTNLFGETDTPIEIYNFYKKLETSKNYSLLISEIEDMCNKYDRPECYVLKGNLHMKMSKIEQAFDDYRDAIACNPNNAAYYAILGRQYFRESNFHEAIEVFSYLVEHKKLLNYAYYVSHREFRLISACCIGNWKIAKEDIDYLPDNFSIYTKPVKGIITKKVLSKSIENTEIIECHVPTSHLS